MYPGYTPEVKAEIMDHVFAQVSTGRAVSRIAQEDDGMPNAETIWRWISGDDDLANKLARARELGIEARLDECQEIADTEPDVKRARLMVDTRMKLAQMLKPKTYGPRVDVTSGGEKLETNQVNDNRLQAIVGLVAQRKAGKALPKPEEETPDADPFS